MAESYADLLELYGSGAEVMPQLEDHWQLQAKGESPEYIDEVRRETAAFYTGFTALYNTVNETTGDTARQLADLRRFAGGREKFKQVLDVGCGDGQRVTRHMGELMADAEVHGVDHELPAQLNDIPPNVSFGIGDFSRLPAKDRSKDLVTAHWSVLNDLVPRTEQLRAFRELKRVLDLGGHFYTDVPRLEGEGGYRKLAEQYVEENPDALYGTIRRSFGEREKRFYIYPEDELVALHEAHDLSVRSVSRWQTKSGQARSTIVSQRVG